MHCIKCARPILGVLHSAQSKRAHINTAVHCIRCAGLILGAAPPDVDISASSPPKHSPPDLLEISYLDFFPPHFGEISALRRGNLDFYPTASAHDKSTLMLKNCDVQQSSSEYSLSFLASSSIPEICTQRVTFET